MFSRFGIFIFLVLSLLWGLAPSVYAQESGIGIRPASIDDRLEPGQTKTFEMVVSNLSESEQLYYLFTRDIASASDSGAPIFSQSPSDRTGYELSDWITFENEQVLVPAGGERSIRFNISAPDDASPGSHFAGIFVSNDPPSIEQSGAAVGYQVAGIVSIRIPGEVFESASIRQFSTNNYIYGTPEVEFKVSVENSGNTLIRPVGPLVIKNMFGQEVANILFNEAQGGVFPMRSRDFIQVWSGTSPAFGRYETTLSLSYGDEGAKKTMSSTVVFWVLPTAIVFPALGILAVLLLITYLFARLYVRRKLRTYTTAGTSRRLVRRQQSNASAFVFITITILAVTALFLLVLLVLFA